VVLTIPFDYQRRPCIEKSLTGQVPGSLEGRTLRDFFLMTLCFGVWVRRCGLILFAAFFIGHWLALGVMPEGFYISKPQGLLFTSQAAVQVKKNALNTPHKHKEPRKQTKIEGLNI
jgi:hypothetical protein